MTEDRFFNNLPRSIQNSKRKRSSNVTGDLIFEPPSVEIVDGLIGDTSDLSSIRLDRTPEINWRSKQEKLLSTAVISQDSSGNITNGSFFEDVVGHLETNGAITDNLERLFEADHFVFNPPINIDIWVNFQRYVWTGKGTVEDTAEYIVQDRIGSLVYLNEVDQSGTLQKRSVTLDTSGLSNFPSSGNTIGDLREDSSDSTRPIFKWDGSDWQRVIYTPVDTEPENLNDFGQGAYLYIASRGSDYQTLTLRRYSKSAGRYICYDPILSITPPEDVSDGVIWEDCSDGTIRPLKQYKNQEWVPLDLPAVSSFADKGVSNTEAYLYDVSAPITSWSKENYWYHVDDLSIKDREKYSASQSIRPVICFWSGIEYFDNVKTVRNQKPMFQAYAWKDNAFATLSDISDSFVGTSIFEFKRSSGADDAVIGYPLEKETTGEIIFDLTLESDIHEDVKGYRFFKDTETGLLHSVWTRSEESLVTDGTPLNWSSNPDHELETKLSRRTLLGHYKSIIENTSKGSALGNNDYRWTLRNPAKGAKIIDSEGSLLRLGALMQDERFDPAEAIRRMAFEYDRFMKRFHARVRLLSQDGTIAVGGDFMDGMDAAKATDRVLTDIVFKTGLTDRAFIHTGMGTFKRTGETEQENITVPPSTTRIGATPAYKPRKTVYPDGTYILGHDGSLVKSEGKVFDDTLLELETRFFNALPVPRKTSVGNSIKTVLRDDIFSIYDFCQNKSLKYSKPDVDEKTSDYSTVTHSNGKLVLDTTVKQVYYSNGSQWTVQKFQKDDTFRVKSDNTSYIHNGRSIFQIPTPDQRTADYDFDDLMSVRRREFERWYASQQKNPFENTQYVEANQFTWNLTDSGLESHWSDIYLRLYNTDRPHIAPWEILGFNLEPSWWSTVYTADTTTDGISYYDSTNVMWADLKTGTLIRNAGITIPSGRLMNTGLPVPVDANGQLVDPVTSGLIELDVIVDASEDWEYSNGSPVNWEFRNSYYGRFADALAGYLLKPARFVELLWSDYALKIGSDDVLFGGGIRVDDDTLRRGRVKSLEVHGENKKSDPGFVSFLTESLILSGASADVLGKAIRSASVSLGWKTQGFIESDDLRIKTISENTIPFEDVTLTIHKSKPFKVETASGIIFVKRPNGYSVHGYNPSNPFFTVAESDKPANSGRIIKKQTFTATEAQNVFNLTDYQLSPNEIGFVSVLINGFASQAGSFRITDKNEVTLDYPVLTGGEEITISLQTAVSFSGNKAKRFNVGGEVFLYYTSFSGKTTDIPYGTEFESAQSIVEFLYEYGEHLRQSGWDFEENWLSVAQRFVAWAQTSSLNQMFIAMPQGKKVTYNMGFGSVDRLDQITGGFYGLLNFAGLPAENIEVYREPEKIVLESSEDILLARLPICSFQHVAFIRQKTRFADIIYDPFTGSQQRRLNVFAKRTSNWNGRIETPGYLSSDSGMIANFETQAKDIERLYDTHTLITDSEKRKLSWSLYGYTERKYVENTAINPVSAFDYHKHMIREKGTQRAARAFSKSFIGDDELQVRECWAWRSGEYGKRINATDISFNIPADQVKAESQIVSLVNTDEDDVFVLPDTKNDSTIWNHFNSDVTFETDQDGSFKLTLQQGEKQIDFFEWNPLKGKHEPYAYSQVDIVSPEDPAFYTSGLGLRIKEEQAWGLDKVGTVWLDNSTNGYTDYLADGLTVRQKASLWGQGTRISVSAVTEDQGDMVVTVPNHGFSVYDQVRCNFKTGEVYIGLVTEQTSTTLKIVIIDRDGEEIWQTTNTPNYEDIDSIEAGTFAVYQWVRSQFPPDTFPLAEYETLHDSANKNYSTHVDPNTNVITYMFWVRRSKEIAPKKNLSAYEIETRLINPTTKLVPWFAIIDKSTLLINMSAVSIKDDIRCRLKFYDTEYSEHDHWQIFIENDPIYPVSDQITNKIIDCLSGVDANGHIVPSLNTHISQRYGPSDTQTIFRDLSKARDVFLSSVNKIMKRNGRQITSGFSNIFKPSEKGTVWNDADFNTLGRLPTEHVSIITQREALIGLKEGDTVRVENGITIGNGMFDAGYIYEDGQWVLFYGENLSASVTSSVFPVLRRFMKDLFSNLSVSDTKEIIFDLIFEMLAQNQDCYWCVKTSLVDVIHPYLVSQPTFERPDQSESVISAFNDVKPFHTKIRRFVDETRLAVDDVPYDLVNVQATDDKEINIVQYVDRLSTNLFDDFAWDCQPWDVNPFDWSPWDRPLLGTQDFRRIASIDIVSNAKEYIGPPSSSHYEHKVIFFDASGNTTQAPTHYLDFNGGVVKILFTFNPPVGTRFEIHRATGVASSDLIQDGDYEYAAAISRQYVNGVHNNRTSTTPVSSDKTAVLDSNLYGGATEERIKASVSDPVSIIVDRTGTTTLEGWDISPWDISPWDTNAFTSEDAKWLQVVSTDYGNQTQTQIFKVHNRQIVNDITETGTFYYNQPRVEYERVRASGSEVLIPQKIDENIIGSERAFTASNSAYGSSAAETGIVYNGGEIVSTSSMLIRTRYGLQAFTNDIYNLSVKHRALETVSNTVNHYVELYVFDIDGALLGTFGKTIMHSQLGSNYTSMTDEFEFKLSDIRQTYSATAFICAGISVDDGDTGQTLDVRFEEIYFSKKVDGRLSVPIVQTLTPHSALASYLYKQDVVDFYASKINTSPYDFRVTSDSSGQVYEDGDIRFIQDVKEDVVVEFPFETPTDTVPVQATYMDLKIIDLYVSDKTEVSFKSIPNGYTVIDDQDGNINTWNGSSYDTSTPSGNYYVISEQAVYSHDSGWSKQYDYTQNSLSYSGALLALST